MNVHGDQPGEDTRDLRKAAGTPGEENLGQERLTQRRGNLCLVGGFATIAVTLLANLATVVIYRDQPFPNPQAKLFANLAFVTVMVLGASLVTVGWIERMLRGNRSRQIAGAAIASDRGEQAVILLQRNIVDMQEDRREIQKQLDVVMAMLGAIPGRLAALDQGLQLLIELLPEEAQRRYWAGFNDAVREGYQATGTDGNKRQPRHIGLVIPPAHDND